MKSIYNMEELLPVVAKLAQRYTSKESTSVTYEQARQLMEAVVYCIHQWEEDFTKNDRKWIQNHRLSAEEAYRIGRETLIQKVKKTQAAYNKMADDFRAYGNENYYDTVTKAIPGFFKYYNVDFAPQSTIITLDYPTICPITDSSGIDAVARYVEYITYEQRFMGKLPSGYVCDILSEFQTDYRKQFDNICSIILRHILSCLLIGRKPGLSGSDDLEEDYQKLRRIVKECGRRECVSRLYQLLEQLIREQYGKDVMLYNYLNRDVEDFVSYLLVGARENTIRNVVVFV